MTVLEPAEALSFYVDVQDSILIESQSQRGNLGQVAAEPGLPGLSPDGQALDGCPAAVPGDGRDIEITPTRCAISIATPPPAVTGSLVNPVATDSLSVSAFSTSGSVHFSMRLFASEEAIPEGDLFSHFTRLPSLFSSSLQYPGLS